MRHEERDSAAGSAPRAIGHRHMEARRQTSTRGRTGHVVGEEEVHVLEGGLCESGVRRHGVHEVDERPREISSAFQQCFARPVGWLLAL